MVGYETADFEPYNLPRQQLPSVFFQTGDIELIQRQTLLSGSISGDHILPLIINPDEVIDIDHVSDLNEAEDRLRANQT